MRMNSGRYPQEFMSYLYQEFHSELPEELFFDDFTAFFRKQYKGVNTMVQNIFRGKYNSEKLSLALEKLIDVEDFPADHPLVSKLSLYIQAHSQYLQTLSINQVIGEKIYWGLKKVTKIEQPRSEEE